MGLFFFSKKAGLGFSLVINGFSWFFFDEDEQREQRSHLFFLLKIIYENLF